VPSPVPTPEPTPETTPQTTPETNPEPKPEPKQALKPKPGARQIGFGGNMLAQIKQAQEKRKSQVSLLIYITYYTGVYFGEKNIM